MTRKVTTAVKRIETTKTGSKASRISSWGVLPGLDAVELVASPDVAVIDGDKLVCSWVFFDLILCEGRIGPCFPGRRCSYDRN
jgi:hypothetical protein